MLLIINNFDDTESVSIRELISESELAYDIFLRNIINKR